MPPFSSIYIVAPAHFASGGPELLHQLGSKLQARGATVAMCYFPLGQDNPVHANYVQYGLDWVNTVVDVEDNLLIVPETFISFLGQFKSIKKSVWWLSVDFYFLGLSGFKGKFNRFIFKWFGSQNYHFFDEKLKVLHYHFVQSSYAESMLRNNGIQNIFTLSDYLHESFISLPVKKDKRNLVIYNPKKGYKFTKRLISKAKHIEFVPIFGLGRSEVVDLMQQAKVYIDFGHHPGKDRIPREAAYSGCCVITSLRGSALFSSDVPIPKSYKFQDCDANIPQIIHQIERCMALYEDCAEEFASYREMISQQECLFEQQIDAIFFCDKSFVPDC